MINIMFIFSSCILLLVGSASQASDELTDKLTSQFELVYNIQDKLELLGFAPGLVDGVEGPNTRRALTEFYQELGKTFDGIISANELADIEQVIKQGRISNVNVNTSGLKFIEAFWVSHSPRPDQILEEFKYINQVLAEIKQYPCWDEQTQGCKAERKTHPALWQKRKENLTDLMKIDGVTWLCDGPIQPPGVNYYPPICSDKVSLYYNSPKLLKDYECLIVGPDKQGRYRCIAQHLIEIQGVSHIISSVLAIEKSSDLNAVKNFMVVRLDANFTEVVSWHRLPHVYVTNIRIISSDGVLSPGQGYHPDFNLSHGPLSLDYLQGRFRSGVYQGLIDKNRLRDFINFYCTQQISKRYQQDCIQQSLREFDLK